MRSTVYPPREDTYLLEEAVESLDLKGKKVLEIGCGNGIVTRALEDQGADITAVDINKNALEETKERLENPQDHCIKYSDLFSEINSSYDIVVFNPPYLDGEEEIGDEEKWYVGDDNILERFFSEIDEYLSGRGEVLVVLSDRTPGIDELKQKHELEFQREKKLWFEKLYVGRYK